jgi:flagellar biosynthesis protein FliP
MTSLSKPAFDKFGSWVAAILAALLLLGWASQSFAQSEASPDPTGWKLTPSLANPDQPGLNRPAAISESPDPAVASLRSNHPIGLNDSAWANPDNEIRQQIGLASFEVTEPQSFSNQGAEEKSSETIAQHDDFSIASLLSMPAGSPTSPSSIQGSIKFAILIGALSLAPAIILMTTCYIRVIVVLSLLKQAFGGHQLPPAQVLTALSLFMTFLIMTPVWNDLKKNAIDPYSANEIALDVAWERGVAPIKRFMIKQIELTGNQESVAVFYKYADVGSSIPPSDLSQVPLNVLIPAFMISELKVAFLLGFQIYLPFLVMDLIVSSVTVSMGMLMLPPQMVSFPLKLILFVMVDGWNLVIGMLLQSFGALL